MARRAIAAATAATLASCGGAHARPPPPPSSLAALINDSSPTSSIFNGQFCGGVLVARNYVLTAAHCVRGRAPGSVDVVVGVNDLCNPSTAMARSRVDAIVFTPPATDTDVAVLHLATSVRAAPAQIARAPQTGDVGTAFGWGREAFAGVAPCLVRTVDLVAAPARACERAGRRSRLPFEPTRWFCAVAGPLATRNTCTGDSGGPVYLPDQRVVGIVAWGAGCGIRDVGAYVRLARIRAWVRSIVDR